MTCRERVPAAVAFARAGVDILNPVQPPMPRRSSSQWGSTALVPPKTLMKGTRSTCFPCRARTNRSRVFMWLLRDLLASPLDLAPPLAIGAAPPEVLYSGRRPPWPALSGNSLPTRQEKRNR